MFLDFQLNNEESPSRVTIELASQQLPITSENFLRLAQGGDDTDFTFQNSVVHKVVQNKALLMGDIEFKDGSGGHSALGTRFFEDENFQVHHRRGTVSMTNAGRNTNNSQFFICLDEMPHLDGRHVAFGAVVEGMDVLDRINQSHTFKQKPLEPVVVVKAGEISE